MPAYVNVTGIRPITLLADAGILAPHLLLNKAEEDHTRDHTARSATGPGRAWVRVNKLSMSTYTIIILDDGKPEKYRVRFEDRNEQPRATDADSGSLTEVLAEIVNAGGYVKGADVTGAG